MDRINHASAEADKFGAGKDGFTDGVPTDPSSGTVVNEDFLDGVQEELVGLIEAAGLTPTNASYAQLLIALMHKEVVSTETVYHADQPLLFKSGEFDDDEARIQSNHAATGSRYPLVQSGASGHLKIYHDDGHGIWFADNVTDTTGSGFWTEDAANSAVARLSLEENTTGVPGPSVSFYYDPDGAGSFNQRFTVTGHKAADTTPTSNSLYAIATPKVAARLNTNGAGGLVAQSNSHGIDIASSSVTASYIEVAFGTPFADTNYIIQLTNADGTRNDNFTGEATATGYCRIIPRDADAGTVIDATGATVVKFYITVSGNH